MRHMFNTERNGKKISVYHLSKEELSEIGKKSNSLAFGGISNKLGRYVCVTDLYLELSKDTRSVVFEHEVAHALGIDDEVNADKRAMIIHGKEKYITAIEESLTLMRKYSTRIYSNKEFNDIVSERVSLALN